MITRYSLQNGVFINEIVDERFKKQRALVAAVVPLKKEELTATALLPYIFLHGTRSCPDLTQMARRLMYLYGADLSRSVVKAGFARALVTSVLYPAPRFSSFSTAAECCSLAAETLFFPVASGGAFPAETVTLEKDNLREAIRAEYNDKRTYCLMRSHAEFYGGDPRGGFANGYEADLDAITPKGLYELYREIISKARIEILTVGERADTAAFGDIEPRTPTPIPEITPVKASKTRFVSFGDSATQQKITLCYTAGRLLSKSERSAFRLGAAMLGAIPTSRLFKNVRERLSLCYSCGASADIWNAAMTVDAGVAHKNGRRFVDAATEELFAVASGRFTSAELSEAKAALKNAAAGVGDSSGALESYYFSRLALGGELTSVSELSRAIESISADEVSAVMSLMNLNVVGSLCGEELE